MNNFLLSVSLRYRTGIASFEERRIVLPKNTTIDEVLDSVKGTHAHLYTCGVRTSFSGKIKVGDVVEIWGSDVEILRSYCRGYVNTSLQD